MGFPWFGTRKDAQKLQSSAQQSKRCNIFSSKSRPTFASNKKSSKLRSRSASSKESSLPERRKYLPSENIVCGEYPKNCPLPSEAELEKVFKTFDANADGKISSSEMREVMGMLGHDPSEEELRLIMAEADSDGDGFVDLAEFVDLNTKGVDSVVILNDLKDAFRVFDVDGNGVISAQELHNVLRRLGERCSLAECENMIGGVDSDGDGEVSFHEFFAMMTKPIAC